MSFSQAELSRIPHVLSEPRFTTYLRHCNNDKALALELYQWNLELSSAFIIPLHLFEITVRNAVVEVLDRVHTSNWAWNKGFLRSLPNPKKGYNAKDNLLSVSAQQPTIGKVVAELKFVFWEKMYTKKHDIRLWNDNIKIVFSDSPENMTSSQLRENIYNNIHSIRWLRNRIAHHEPIFTNNITEDYKKVLDIISWKDHIAANWLNRIQTVTTLMGNKPI